jgi:CheY-like chemotaxis protein
MRVGIVKEVDLLGALSEQHGVPGMDLSEIIIPTANLHLVPVDVAKQYLILPVEVKEHEILLAMADPGDRRIIEEIEFVTGRTVRAHVSLHGHLKRVVETAYELLERGESHYIGPNAPAESLELLGLRIQSQRPVLRKERVEPQHTNTEAESEPSARPSARPREPYSLDEPAAAHQYRILVVDDEDDIRRMLRRVLQERGYQVYEAASGTDALRLLRDHNPHLILLDAMLPDLHGLEVCRRIKTSKAFGHVPIIMLSAIYRGWRFAEDLRESYGVPVFLEKPFKISEVTRVVEHTLAGQAEAREEDEELSPSASEALTSGIDAYKSGNIDQAIAHLKRGVGSDSLSFRLHYHLGLLYGRRDDLFDAIHEMETAVNLAPRNFAALKNLAVLYQRAGFKHRAIEIWERAIGSAPDEETKGGIKELLVSLL